MPFEEQENQLTENLRKRLCDPGDDSISSQIKRNKFEINHMNTMPNQDPMSMSHLPFFPPSNFNSAMFLPFPPPHQMFHPHTNIEYSMGSIEPNCPFNNSKDRNVPQEDNEEKKMISSGVSSEDSSQILSEPTTPIGSDSQEEEIEEGEEEIHLEESKPLKTLGSIPPTFSSLSLGHVLYNPNDIFETVPSRTALLAASTKYKVTIGEIIRRISPPECLHASLINGILRKAKAKDGGKALRLKLMQDYGVSLPQGRRKTAPATSFTALCEEEAVGMARDFHVLCEDFAATDVGMFMAKRSSMNRIEMERRRQQMHSVKSFLDEMAMIILSAGSHPRDYDSQKDNLGEATLAVQNFGLLTHGFGPNALVASLQVMKNITIKTMEMLDQGINLESPSSSSSNEIKRMPMLNMGPQMMNALSSNPFSIPNYFPPSTNNPQFPPYFHRNDFNYQNNNNTI